MITPAFGRSSRLLRLAILLPLSAFLLPADAEAHCDEIKHKGDHPHCQNGGSPPPPPPPPPPGATSCPGDFPAFAYAVEITGNRRGGHTERSDLFVSNADGSCEVLVHSVSTADFYDDLDFHFDSSADIYRIAYNYESDESDDRTTGGRPNIRVMEFTVSPDPADATRALINENLPLDVHKIYRYSRNSTSGRGLLGNDMLGNSMVFALEYGEAVGTKKDPANDWYDEIWVIEDLADCIANAGPDPDESCGTLVFASDANRPALDPVWGLDNNRIYIGYDWDASSGTDWSVAMLDRAGPGNPWSAPGAVRLDSDDGSQLNFAGVALWSQGSGAPFEAMRLNVNGYEQIFNISSACTAAAATTQSCYSQGLMTLAKDLFPLTYAGEWTSHPTIGSGPNFLKGERGSGIITEIDPDGGTETDVMTGLPQNNIWVAPDYQP